VGSNPRKRRLKWYPVGGVNGEVGDYPFVLLLDENRSIILVTTK
jgi:hypothetical protein